MMKRLAYELRHDPAGLGLRAASDNEAVALLCRPNGRFSRAQSLRLNDLTADVIRRVRRAEKLAPAQPAVSIVVPAYNAEQFIRQCIESLLDQTFADFEVIAVDDGSTDRTGAMLDEFAVRDGRVTVIHQANAGTGHALNSGFDRARGRYLTWWSADSYVSPHWLATLVATLEAHTDVDFVYSDWAVYDEPTGTVQPKTVPEFDSDRLQRECYIGPSWLFRRSLKDRAGPYQTAICEDYAMHLRMASLGTFRRVPGVLAYWRNHKGNLTNTVSVPSAWRDGYRAQAREKWSRADLKIAYVCPKMDPAGVGWWLTRCVNELVPGVAARHVLGRTTHIGQLDDLKFGSDDDEIGHVLDECDVIHCNQVLPDYGPTDLAPWLDRGKRLILHLHGGQDSWNTARIARYRDAYGATIVTCTPSLVTVVPGVIWLPNPLPVLADGTTATHHELFRPGPAWPDCGSPLRVLCNHNYELAKGMDAIREVVRALRDEYGVSLDASIGANQLRLHQHIEHKKGFDVVIDQITQGFIGMAGWESLAQGAVVIARLDNHACTAYERVFGCVPPVLNVPWIDQLAIELMDLAKRPDRVRAIKQGSRQWALEHYHADKMLTLWGDLYREVLGR